MTATDRRRLARLQKELKNIVEDPTPLITVETKNESLSDWIATIQGPPGTPYEGGNFKLSLHFPPNYPFKPPRVKFITPIYHANISHQGIICMDILREDKWSPLMSGISVLKSVQSLMPECNSSDPFRAEIAALYEKNREEYNRRAHEFTQKYAT